LAIADMLSRQGKCGIVERLVIPAQAGIHLDLDTLLYLPAHLSTQQVKMDPSRRWDGGSFVRVLQLPASAYFL
jgi:hypothetical protein